MVGLLAGLTGTAFAVDTACIGVQLASAEQRFANLPAVDRQALAPLISEIRALAQQVEQRAAASEKRYETAYQAARQTYLSTHPGQNDQQVWAGVLQTLRSGDPLDSALADHFEAQALIHDVEVRMATAAARLPSVGDRRELRRVTGHFAGRSDVDQTAVAAMRSNSAFGQLISALVVAQTAMTGSDIPAGALVGRRFDDRMNDPSAAAAVEATNVMLALDGDRLGSNLLRNHLEDTLRVDAPVRQDMMRAQTRTSRTVSRQFGTELIRRTSDDRATRKMANLAREALAPPRPNESAQAKDRRISAETKRTVEKVKTLRIRLLPPDPSSSDRQ